MVLILSMSLCSADRKSIWRERLSIREYIVGGLPVLLVFLGGLIGALFGIMGATFNYNHMRQEKSFIKQLLVSPGRFHTLLCSLFYICYWCPVDSG